MGQGAATASIVVDCSPTEVGQWTIQHHFNYTFNSRRPPDFPGGLVPNHALNATPEFAYGATPWFEFETLDRVRPCGNSSAACVR